MPDRYANPRPRKSETITEAATPIPVVFDLHVVSTIPPVETRGVAVAWTRSLVRVRYADHRGAEKEIWVKAEAVRRVQVP